MLCGVWRDSCLQRDELVIFIALARVFASRALLRYSLVDKIGFRQLWHGLHGRLIMAHPPPIDFLCISQLLLLLLIKHGDRVFGLLRLTFPAIFVFTLARVCWAHRDVAWVGSDRAAVLLHVLLRRRFLLLEDVLSSSEKLRCLLPRGLDFRLDQPQLLIVLLELIVSCELAADRRLLKPFKLALDFCKARL